MTNEMDVILTDEKGKPLFEMNKKKVWQIVAAIIIGVGIGLAFLLNMGGTQ